MLSAFRLGQTLVKRNCVQSKGRIDDQISRIFAGAALAFISTAAFADAEFGPQGSSAWRAGNPDLLAPHRNARDRAARQGMVARAQPRQPRGDHQGLRPAVGLLHAWSTAIGRWAAGRWSVRWPTRASFSAESSYGKGQVKAADYFLQPDIVSTNKNSGGGGAGAAIGGLLGHFGGWGGAVGALAGGINVKKGEANVTLSLVNGANHRGRGADRRLCAQDGRQLGRRRRRWLVGRLRGGGRYRLPEHRNRPDHRARLPRRLQEAGSPAWRRNAGGRSAAARRRRITINRNAGRAHAVTGRVHRIPRRHGHAC